MFVGKQHVGFFSPLLQLSLFCPFLPLSSPGFPSSLIYLVFLP